MKQMNSMLASTNPYKQKTKLDKKRYDAYLYKIRAGFYAWLFDFTCQGCGLRNETRTLNFHHTIPEDKELTVLMSTGWKDKLKVLKEILEKCVYICENCHYQTHADMGDLDEDFTTINRRRHTYIQNLLGCTE